MAGRPTKKRTAKSYGSEIAMLQRLRTAIFLDRSLPDDKRQTAMASIDKLCEDLNVLIDIVAATNAA